MVLSMKLYDFIRQNPERSLVIAAGVVSSTFLVAALIGQYGFNLHPCELCIAQRVPYIMIMLVGAAACLGIRSQQLLDRLVLLCALLFFIDGSIAIYHAGVELGVFPGPSGCTNNDKPGASLEEMRAAIMNAQLVPCDQPMAYILGLSMATWNAAAAMCSAAATFLLGKRIHA